MLSIIKLDDLKNSPSIRIEIPNALFVGSKLNLKLTLYRKYQGRREELTLNGLFQVSSVVTEVIRGVKQVLQVTSLGVAPVWKAVKSLPHRPLADTHPPKTEI